MGLGAQLSPNPCFRAHGSTYTAQKPGKCNLHCYPFNTRVVDGVSRSRLIYSSQTQRTLLLASEHSRPFFVISYDDHCHGCFKTPYLHLVYRNDR
jgi:hypothetical protein